MLNLTYEYKLIPTDAQRETLDLWLNICRQVYNYALRERKDWVNSRKCEIDSCSIRQEYIGLFRSYYAFVELRTFLFLFSSAPLLLCSSAPLLLCSSAPLLLCSNSIVSTEEPHFLAISDGQLITSSRFFVDGQCKLKSLQRQLERQKKGSRKSHQLQHRIAKHYEYISNSRSYFHFKTAHQLCDRAGMIFAEDLNIKAMSAGMLCKHTLDAGFGQFLNILSHVCFKRGKYFAKVDANGTSQTCPRCQTHTGKKLLSERVHQCPECGYQTNRDVAAAQVVLQREYTAVGHIAVNFGEGKLHE